MINNIESVIDLVLNAKLSLLDEIEREVTSMIVEKAGEDNVGIGEKIGLASARDLIRKKREERRNEQD